MGAPFRITPRTIRRKWVSGSDLPDPARGLGHGLEGEHEAREQHRGQEEEERHLHGLELRAGRGGDHEAHGEHGGEERQRADAEVDEGATDRHVEEQHAERQHEADLHVAHDEVGQDLAHHDLAATDRRGDQELEGAALPLAHDGQGGHQHHGHGEDHADQTRAR